MRTDLNVPCPCGAPWPARECAHPEPSYATALAVIAGLGATGWLCIVVAVVATARAAIRWIA